MALRRQSLSPTANLLRNSRLFSLPNPLPKPPVTESYGAGTQKISDTATLPFPTHQAIATTPKSLARGDWGLKRPLPSRSRIVQKANPVVKVTQLDTIEHITDFDSASDHVRTRQKFEELSVPMLKGMAAMREQALGVAASGAFDRRSDMTSYEEDEGLDEAGVILEAIKKSVAANNAKAKKTFVPFNLPQPDMARHNARRWKHEGPWLPGMSADEFTKYMTEQLSRRKAEFNKYLRHYVKNEIYTSRQVASRNKTPENPLDLDAHLAQQEDPAYIASQEKVWAKISHEEIQAGIHKLRAEAAVNPLQSKLVQRLIVPFLRIPTIKLKDTTFSADAKSDDAVRYRFDDDVAPLSTHPSAGLGYLRTNAVVSNHPILGPQKERAPVQARVIESRTASRSTTAKLGVAGFVTNDEFVSTGERKSYRSNEDPAYDIDIHTPGGAKINVLPRYASVTNNGRVHIKLARSVGAEVQVARGELEDRPPVRSSLENPEDLLRGLASGSSGTELDEQSPQAKQFMQSLGDVARPARQAGIKGAGVVQQASQRVERR
ncbi:hypothetical protein DPSP01_014010 [Paraphaeosphaeria sporulosa]|uniref:Uncharacterized protein n=1 Tax=Paraphaeosphaeria sporulosa TaxID=1460663 RepID=A0A177C5H0_9PLEO|nr:uncharacterized protein CC84DRAFT_1167128 [Paraphaeosphaeria sporulosa]OAG01967.1 hypothetical protein CC84DRAFT_1167128 [Paraphaeosphaeria sporulosa]